MQMMGNSWYNQRGNSSSHTEISEGSLLHDQWNDINNKLMEYVEQKLQHIHTETRPLNYECYECYTISCSLDWREEERNCIKVIRTQTTDMIGLLYRLMRSIVDKKMIPFLYRNWDDRAHAELTQHCGLPQAIESIIKAYAGRNVDLHAVIQVICIFSDVSTELHKLDAYHVKTCDTLNKMEYSRPVFNQVIGTNHLLIRLIPSVFTSVCTILHNQYTLEQLCNASFRLPKHHIVHSLIDACSLLDKDWKVPGPALCVLHREFDTSKTPSGVSNDSDRHIQAASKTVLATIASSIKLTDHDEQCYQII